MKAVRWLILARHAAAETGTIGQSDQERALSALGESEADAAADFLAGVAGLPSLQHVLCSPAKRTQQTAERILARLGAVDTELDARIYEATPGVLLDVLDEHVDAHCVMLVGHNPGMEMAVALLCSGRSGAYRGMPPGAIAIVRVAAGQSLEPGAAELVAFWSP
jgi:phosphohistidine phosphatase SixA